MTLQIGLLGRKLGHSYSPEIHGLLGDYAYNLYEREEAEIEALLRNPEIAGLNVTIPYKKTVIPFLDELSDAARAMGSVNTIVRREDGSLYGDSTDPYGFRAMVRHSGISVENRKTLVLGNGGAAAAVLPVLSELGAKTVVISRKGEDNYGNLDRHKDAEVIVNTTPVGMYPNTGESPVDLSRFPQLKGVLDIVYNPVRTALCMQAEALGIPFESGLYMLVGQAKRSSELWTGKTISDEVTDRVFHILSMEKQNIVLVGMPGAGKSTIAAELGKALHREVLDSDAEITVRTGKRPSEIINEQGEPAFRKIESEVLRDLGKLSGKIIACGGGVVTREENYPSLHGNGKIVWIRRPLADLARSDRPLSARIGVEELFRVREPLYRRFSDIVIDVAENPQKTCDLILEALQLKGSNKE